MKGAHGHDLRFVALITAVASLGGFLFGFDSGVINGTVQGLQEAFDSDAAGTGFNVASMLLGCAVGAFFAGRLADIAGRRNVLFVAAVLFIVSAYLSGAATGSALFVFARVIGGFAVGAASVIAPAYISEIAPAELRGRLTSIQQVMIIVGLTASFVSNYLLAEVAGGSREVFWAGYASWRWMFWTELVPATAFLFLLFAIPESPRFLVLKGKEGKARSVVERIVGSDRSDAKIDQIRSSFAQDHKPRLVDLVDRNTGRLRPIVWAGIGLAAFQQLVGINIVF